MINSFTCKNFRNISVENIELKKINLLIGPNISGKTNFIRALTFYSNMLKKAHEETFHTDFYNALSRNGWWHTLKQGEPAGSPISFKWNIDLGEETVDFSFSYVTGKEIEDYAIILEELNGEPNDKYDKAFNNGC